MPTSGRASAELDPQNHFLIESNDPEDFQVSEESRDSLEALSSLPPRTRVK
jgi:hypothetical protein